MELESGCPVEDLEAWFKQEQPAMDVAAYGFQEFLEFLNYAQDKTVVRLEPTEEQGMLVSLGAEFVSAGCASAPEPEAVEEEEVEVYEPQPYVEGQPTIFEPNPPPAKVKRAPSSRKRVPKQAGGAPRRVRRKKPD